MPASSHASIRRRMPSHRNVSNTRAAARVVVVVACAGISAPPCGSRALVPPEHSARPDVNVGSTRSGAAVNEWSEAERCRRDSAWKSWFPPAACSLLPPFFRGRGVFESRRPGGGHISDHDSSRFSQEPSSGSCRSSYGACVGPSPSTNVSRARSRIVGRGTAAYVNCYAKGAAKGMPTDAACLAKAAAKFAPAFDELEAGKICPTRANGRHARERGRELRGQHVEDVDRRARSGKVRHGQDKERRQVRRGGGGLLCEGGG